MIIIMVNLPLCFLKVETIGAANWSALGDGFDNGYISSIAKEGNNLYVGGSFNNSGGNSGYNKVAKWDGSNWSPLGTGIVEFSVEAIAVSGNNVYVGGYFTFAGGIQTNYIAKWDGTNWSPLGSGLNGYVFAIAINGNDVYVGGSFTAAGGIPANYIAKWDGTNWSPLGSGLNSTVRAISVDGNDLYVGGNFNMAGDSSAIGIAKWNGTNWSRLGEGLFFGNSPGAVYTIAIKGNNVYVGGEFHRAGSITVNHIAKWNGSWSSLGGGVNSFHRVNSIAISDNDEIFAGGTFETAGGIPVNYIAKWNGTNWSSLDDGTNSSVNSILISGNDVFVGGGFILAGGIVVNRIARWTDPSISINPISTEIPATFSLSQNYPNPFNPNTKIRFSVPKNEYVKLIVYNSLGKEIATLVNEKLSAGTYEFNFDGEGLPSGIYFYKLQNDKRVQTRKMILTK